MVKQKHIFLLMFFKKKFKAQRKTKSYFEIKRVTVIGKNTKCLTYIFAQQKKIVQN